MAAIETSLANAFETQLTANVTDSDLTFPVGSIGSLTSPTYLVIDPDNPTKREYVFFNGTFTATDLVTTALANRGLAGSASGAQSHTKGAKVRAVPMQQHFEDLHDRMDTAYTVGGADVAVADGGTGASTAPVARTNLGAAADAEVVHLAGAETITGAKTFSTDPTLADGSSALSLTEGNAAYLASGGIFDPLHSDYGAVADWNGTTGTDDAAAIQAAADAATAAGGTLRIRKGDYRILSTITILCAVDAEEGARFIVDDPLANPGIQVGTATTSCDGKSIRLPKVVQNDVVRDFATPTIGTDVGVKLVAADNNSIWVPLVQNFSYGLDLASDSNGVAYNTVTVGHLASNAINLAVRPGSTGFVNQNTFIGGRYQTSNAVSNQAGIKQILIADTAGNTANGNVFVNPSIEGDAPDFHIDCYGTANLFIAPRFDVPSGDGRVRWGVGTKTATDNLILGGYDSHSIAVTEDAGALYNTITANRVWRSRLSSTGPVWAVTNGATSDHGIALLAAGKSPYDGDANTAYQARLAAGFFSLKAQADAWDRLVVNNTLGRLYLGDGTTDPGLLGYLRANATNWQLTAPITLSGNSGPHLPVSFVAGSLGAVGGAVTEETLSGASAFGPVGKVLPDSTSRAIGGQFYADLGGTVNVDVRWMPNVATGGAVRFRFDYVQSQTGEDVDVAPTSLTVDSTAPAVHGALVTERVATGITLDADHLFMFHLWRFGSNAADTLAGGAHVVEIVISRA